METGKQTEKYSYPQEEKQLADTVHTETWEDQF